MNERLSVQLRPSRSVAWLLAGAYALAAVAVWLTPVPAVWSLAGTLALAGTLLRALQQHAWQTAKLAVVALELREDCSVYVLSRGGTSAEYQVAGTTFVSPLLTLLSLKAEAHHRARYVLMLPDSLDANSFRRLRVWLRCRYTGRESGRGVSAL